MTDVPQHPYIMSGAGMRSERQADFAGMNALLNYPELLENMTLRELVKKLRSSGFQRSGFQSGSTSMYRNDLQNDTDVSSAYFITADGKLMFLEIDYVRYLLTINVNAVREATTERDTRLRSNFQNRESTFYIDDHTRLIQHVHPESLELVSKISASARTLIASVLDEDSDFRNPIPLEEWRKGKGRPKNP